MNKKYHIIVFGCQMNVSDGERVSAVLESLKYKKTSDINEADIIAVVMCSVRQSAVDRIFGLIEKFKNLHPHTKRDNKAIENRKRGVFRYGVGVNKKPTTILTGCILKKDKKIFAKDFDYVVDIKDIKKISQILKPVSYKVSDRTLYKTSNYLDIKPKYSSGFSANVPIMTGCNNFCSYCVVPYAREREISRPAKKIVSEIKNLIKNNCKEIWLLGQNVNSYISPIDTNSNTNSTNNIRDISGHIRANSREINFPKLLKIINNISGNFWIRFTSSHPKDFNSEVINALATGGKITPYLNLPIQSGDDKILKAMNRHYTVKDYKNKIKELRKKIPNICLSTDIIVGFPNETKKQFGNTVKLFKEIKFDMAYINKYSPRAGTAAAKLKDNIPISEKKRREKDLTEILKQTALEKNKKFVGKTVEVLVDSIKGQRLFGRTKKYKNIEFDSDKNLIGKFIKIKVIDATPWKLKGILSQKIN